MNDEALETVSTPKIVLYGWDYNDIMRICNVYKINS